LGQIIDAAQKRLTAVRRINEEEAAHKAAVLWGKVRAADAGAVAVTFVDAAKIYVIVVPAGKRRGMPKAIGISQGTIMRVRVVQPKKMLAWFTCENGETLGFTVSQLVALGVQVFQDELTAHIAMAKHGLLKVPSPSLVIKEKS
jgi:hypothetical protein